MNTSRNEHDDQPRLDPFPEGWYFIASRKTIEKKKLVQRTWMGKQIVIWCDEEENICVAENICPHMGSELGPEAGGQVRNGCLVCPFHGFEYDVTGQCVATPNAPPPESARLKVYETSEIRGIVFAWWGIGGRQSQWNLPELPLDETEWSGLEFRSIRFRGHPQETSENSVDLGHLSYVHGYDNVNQVGSVSVDGAFLKSCVDFTRYQTIAGKKVFSYDVSTVIHVYGLGCSFVEVHEQSIGMDTRLWVLTTPVDGKNVELVLVSQVRRILKPKRLILGMRYLPLNLRTWIINKFIIASQKRDVLQDVVIWNRRHHLPNTRLCSSDGEIRLYRRYCEQFYPDTTGSN